jgi:hypothetical protein
MIAAQNAVPVEKLEKVAAPVVTPRPGTASPQEFASVILGLGGVVLCALVTLPSLFWGMQGNALLGWGVPIVVMSGYFSLLAFLWSFPSED